MRKTSLSLQTLVSISILLSPLNAQTVKYTAHYLEPDRGPQSYKDIRSGVIFYVESDGRHLVAINSEGKILWHKDPFADAHLEHYRTNTPRIVFIGEEPKGGVSTKSGRCISISFNSSQFGVVDINTGDFTFLGQD